MIPALGGDIALAKTQPVSTVQSHNVPKAIEKACDYLLNRQQSKGFWVGELEGDITLESDYVILQLWLHQPNKKGNWSPPTRSRIDDACHHILKKQLTDGGWNLFPGGPANVSAAVKAYFALKLGGIDSHEECMQRARGKILALGGVEAANSYNKIYLSYFGLFPRHKAPSIPPEIFQLPAINRFSIYGISSWSRAMLAPLSILDASKAYRRVPAGFHIQEIFTGRAPEASEILSWKRFFMLVDKTIKVLESSGIRRNRQKALEAATNWMLAHLEGSEGLGAIYPAMMNSIMALTQLGNGTQHPMLQQQIKHLDDLILEDEKGFRVQPCHSPVWDTAMTAYAIGSTQRVMSEPAQWALNRAADWLLDRQAKRRGDWAIRNPAIEPGGWYFEYANEFYPDTDDTAKVLLALEWASASDTQLQQEAETRALKWLVSMQSSDGGWAAFDVDNCARILTQVPFADHNAMLDPTCADITGRVLEALSGRNRNQDRGAMEKGVRYLLQSQQPDGSWYGRWGVNYLYGTCFALRGLRAAGTDPSEASMICGAEWIRSIQNSDGGWGETATSYDDSDCKNIGDSTPSQTAWALLALFATNDYLSSSVKAGVNYLLFTQNQQGTWQEEPFTGTGFPGVFYLRYHMYPQYFPLIALGEYLHQDRWESR